MSAHIADEWERFERAVIAVAAKHPHVEFTCIRDVYGRSSARLTGGDAASLDAARAMLSRAIQGSVDEALLDHGGLGINWNLPTSPLDSRFLASPVVDVLDAESRLGRLIVGTRRPLTRRRPGNTFLVERLLANQSWIAPEPATPDDPGAPPVVAFYSFKGGVGRSTLAASTALEAARRGKSVALVDLDLEAPGIQGFFFPPDDDESPEIRAGVVDYLLERRLSGGRAQANFGDFVLPYTDSALEAKGGALVIVPAGRVDSTYVERLGRVDLAAPGGDDVHPIRALLTELREWRSVDLIVVDCRTGFTDVGGVTLNGLSTVDVLVFKAGPADRMHLPTVLSHISRFRDAPDCTLEVAEALARSFLVVFTMVEWPSKESQAREEQVELRRFTSEACWKHIFEPFADCGYVYPEVDASDSPLEAVPHDLISVPYMRDWARTSSVSDIVRLQREHPDSPVDALVRRLFDVKLAPTGDAVAVDGAPSSSRDDALRAVADVVGKPESEEEFRTVDDLRDKFLPRAAHRSLLEQAVFVVLGRKGSGKSALFRLLLHPTYLAAVASHIGLDERWAKRTDWLDGFVDPSPQTGVAAELRSVVFVDAQEDAGEDPDKVIGFWRATAAWRIARRSGTAIDGIAEPRDCLKVMRDRKVRDNVDTFLDGINRQLSDDQRWICLCYDRLDVDLTRDPAKRGPLLSGLVMAWQEITRRWPRIRTKIFLREDIWEREVEFDDKAKVRDGIDRARVTWDHVDLYRAVLKRLAVSASVRGLLAETRLWSSRFDAQLREPLGFMPPSDEDWVRPAIEALAGETMAQGESGYKRGYVYTWLVKHTTDAQDVLRPRNLLLLFSEAARLQHVPVSAGGLIGPASIRNALRGEVSKTAVGDLRDEFKQEWKAADGQWIPDTLYAIARVWPVWEKDLLDHLGALGVPDPGEMLDRMVAGGLFERRRRGAGADSQIELQIPDIYLYGLGLTRKG